MAAGRLWRWRPVVLLGLATVGSYGVASYAIGVLIAPISEDTGWSTGTVSLAFSLGVLGSGGVAVGAGWLLDRTGSRPVLLGATLAGTPALLLASFAQEPWQFLLAWGAGGAAVAGGLFYHVSMPVTARLYPRDRVLAFSVLTFIGALASPIFYPLAGALVAGWGWRIALRVLVLLMFALVLPAALGARAPAGAAGGRRGAISARAVAQALRTPAVSRTMLTFALASLATSALMLHQVPALRGAGLSLAAASGFAGARGLLQIPGRVVLAPLTGWLGVRGALACSYVSGMTAALALLVALSGLAVLPMAVLFAAGGGLAIGLLSPLYGLLAAEVYGSERLGTLTGIQQLLLSVTGAAGPWLAGVAVDATGSYRLSMGAAAALLLAALAALAWQRRAPVAAPGAEAAEERPAARAVGEPG